MEKAKDTALVKDTIMGYNKMLIEAAKTGDTESLKDLLIQREREKLNHWIASWHDSNVYMDGRLENIKFKKYCHIWKHCKCYNIRELDIRVQES